MGRRKDDRIELIHLRKAKGLTQRELAKEVGIPYTTIASYETTKDNPTLKNAMALAEYFGIPVTQIKFGGK